MINLSIDAHEFTTLATSVKGGEQAVKRNLSKAGRTAGFLVTGQARVEAPVGKVAGGNLRNTIGPPHIQQTGIATSVEVTAHAAYAYIVHEGRGEVVPVNARVLRWFGPGGPVFSMRSKAVPPNRFMDRALQKTESQIYAAFDRALSDSMRELGLT